MNVKILRVCIWWIRKDCIRALNFKGFEHKHTQICRYNGWYVVKVFREWFITLEKGKFCAFYFMDYKIHTDYLWDFIGSGQLQNICRSTFLELDIIHLKIISWLNFCFHVLCLFISRYVRFFWVYVIYIHKFYVCFWTPVDSCILNYTVQ